MTINSLFKIIELRKKEMDKDSYVSFLIKKGTDAIVQKVGEESTEVIIASKNKLKKEIIYEVSDLFFMLLVLLSSFNINIEEIYKELQRRKK